MPHPLSPVLHRRTIAGAALAALLALAPAGCDFVGRYLAETPEDQLVQAVLAQWAAPGKPFLERVSGRDTVASVTATGSRSWEVAVMPLEGGSPVVWALEVSRVEAFPVFPGEAFGRFLSERVRELDLGTFVPPEMLAGMASGAILEVADVEVRYGLSERGERNTETRVAFLSPGPAGADPVWHIQERSRGSDVLLRALRKVTDDMIQRDDRVLSCMGTGTASGVPRATQLDCIRKAWEQEFGQRS